MVLLLWEPWGHWLSDLWIVTQPDSVPASWMSLPLALFFFCASTLGLSLRDLFEGPGGTGCSFSVPITLFICWKELWAGVTMTDLCAAARLQLGRHLGPLGQIPDGFCNHISQYCLPCTLHSSSSESVVIFPGLKIVSVLGLSPFPRISFSSLSGSCLSPFKSVIFHKAVRLWPTLFCHIPAVAFLMVSSSCFLITDRFHAVRELSGFNMMSTLANFCYLLCLPIFIFHFTHWTCYWQTCGVKLTWECAWVSSLLLYPCVLLLQLCQFLLGRG